MCKPAHQLMMQQLLRNVFIYSWYGAHQDLHSFPTRRSSDLQGDGPGHASATVVGIASPHTSTARSEEHTSELQSRLHLVCRLLLEKKKLTTSISMRLQCSAAPPIIITPSRASSIRLIANKSR